MKSSTRKRNTLVVAEKLLSKMSKDTEVHPSSDLLAAFQMGQLKDEDAKAVDEHLSRCKRCKEQVDWLEAGDRAVGLEPERKKAPQATHIEKIKSAITRILAFPLPVRLAPQAAAADWEASDIPDNELRLDKKGDGPFEVFLQRFGDWLVIKVYFDESRQVELQFVRDADTGEPLGARTKRQGRTTWIHELGSAKERRGRSVVVNLSADGQVFNFEVEIGARKP